MSAKLFKDIDFFAAVKWNAQYKVVMDHRTGLVLEIPTNEERAKRHLPVLWHVNMLAAESRIPLMP